MSSLVSPDRSTAAPHALIVEDAPEQRLMLTAALRHAGFVVTALADGDQVVAEAIRLQPALICLDVVLPNLGGLELCEQLKATPATAHIPVMVMTARGSVLDRVQAELAGADEFQVKPLDPFSVGVCARAMIKRRSIVSA